MGTERLTHWTRSSYYRVRNKIRKVVLGPKVFLDRIVMNVETQRLVNQTDVKSHSTLEISGDHWRNYGFRKYRTLEYPAFDICEPLTLTETFDLIIAEQVFEHLKYPYRAGKNIHRLLNNNGHLLITVPFLQKIHDWPIDCSRWSELGLKYFLEECGFDPARVVTGSWGNAEAARANLASRVEFPFYIKFLHPLKNDPVFPVQVWALATK